MPTYSNRSPELLKHINIHSQGTKRKHTNKTKLQASDIEDVSQSPDGDTYSREDEVTTMYLNNNKHTNKYSLLITQSLQHTYTHIYTVTQTNTSIFILKEQRENTKIQQKESMPKSTLLKKYFIADHQRSCKGKCLKEESEPLLVILEN